MKNKRLWSLGLTGVLVVSACGCGKSTETAEGTVEEAVEENVQAAEIAKETASRSVGGNVEKSETVYVNADASGNVKNITVSNWLKNGSGASELTDVTELNDVVNVKGDETFTKDGDTYVWAANGSDIYYQGETSEALPVNVKVTYYLDDKEIDPSELAGKSGKVRIRFDYENLTAQKAVIGGEETTLCVPFVAASTLVLDSDKFVNVEVENGKVLSEGKNTIVAGVAMPGLYESLDLMNLEGFEDIDIPEYVEVTADVTEFELDMTATVLMPDVFSELNTDDMDGFDDLKDDIEELNDATYELIDGCIELDDGVQELKDNMPDLWDGAVELDDGAKELDDGAQDLMDGADELNDGAKEIRDGAGELDEGVGTLQAGVERLNDSMPELTGGVDALAAGLETLQNSMMLGSDGKSGNAKNPYIKTSVGLLKNGVDALAAGISGMGTAMKQSIAENQIKMKAAEANVGVLKSSLEQAVGEAMEIQNQLNELAKQMGLISSNSSAPGDGASGSDSPDGAVSDSTPEDSNTSEDSSTPEDNGTPKDSSTPEDNSTPEAAQEETSKTGTETGTEAGSEAQGESGGAAGAVSDESETPAKEELEDAAIEPGSAPDAGGSGQASEPEDTQAPAAEEAAVPDEKPDSVSEEPASEEAGAGETVTEETAAEETATEEAAAEEQAPEPEEQSEFAESYLDGLDESDGMTSMSMVQTAANEQGAAVSDPAAVIAGYQKVVALQTKLILKLNEITELQNQLRDAATAYAGLAGADTAMRQISGQLSAGAGADQLAQLTKGMAALETSIGQIYDGVALINSQMGALTGGAAQLTQGIGELKDGTESLKGGTEKLYQGGIDLREGTKELYDGTQELKDGTEELKDGTQELKDGVVDLVDGVDELKDGTEELLDGVYEYNDDGIQKLYETVTVDLQNVVDRVDAVSDLSAGYQSFSGKSDAMEGSVKFIIETEAIELDED